MQTLFLAIRCDEAEHGTHPLGGPIEVHILQEFLHANALCITFVHFRDVSLVHACCMFLLVPCAFLTGMVRLAASVVRTL